MTDFDYEVKERKKLAYQSRYRKGKVKCKRGCTLPCDRLTAAQLRMKNGKENTYMLDIPISWAKFKTYPDDVKKEYILLMREKHKANNTDLARMFGLDPSTLSHIMKRLGISSPRGKSSKMHRKEWQKWLNDWEVKVIQPPVEYVDYGESDDIANMEPEPAPEPTTTDEAGLLTTAIHLHFSGEFRLADLADALARQPIPSGKVEVSVTIVRKED